MKIFFVPTRVATALAVVVATMLTVTAVGSEAVNAAPPRSAMAGIPEPGAVTRLGHSAAAKSTTPGASNGSPITTAALAKIVCGGTKSGTGWKTYPSGGYVGDGCGAGIDYITTPTSGRSVYNLGPSDGTYQEIHAWIPTIYAYANAVMDFTLYICGSWADTYRVDQSTIGGWLILYGISGYSGCQIRIEAWTGMVTAGRNMGLDAVRRIT